MLAMLYVIHYLTMRTKHPRPTNVQVNPPIQPLSTSQWHELPGDSQETRASGRACRDGRRASGREGARVCRRRDRPLAAAEPGAVRACRRGMVNFNWTCGLRRLRMNRYGM